MAPYFQSVDADRKAVFGDLTSLLRGSSDGCDRASPEERDGPRSARKVRITPAYLTRMSCARCPALGSVRRESTSLPWQDGETRQLSRVVVQIELEKSLPRLTSRGFTQPRQIAGTSISQVEPG